MSRAAEIEKPRLSVGATKLGIPARFTKKGSLTQAGKGLEPKDGEKEAELRRKLLNGTESALQYYNNLWPFHSLLENSCTVLNFARMTRRESLQIWRRRKTEEIFSIESFSKLHVRSEGEEEMGRESESERIEEKETVKWMLSPRVTIPF